jgi:hypothetical protein
MIIGRADSEQARKMRTAETVALFITTNIQLGSLQFKIMHTANAPVLTSTRHAIPWAQRPNGITHCNSLLRSTIASNSQWFRPKMSEIWSLPSSPAPCQCSNGKVLYSSEMLTRRIHVRSHNRSISLKSTCWE